MLPPAATSQAIPPAPDATAAIPRIWKRIASAPAPLGYAYANGRYKALRLLWQHDQRDFVRRRDTIAVASAHRRERAAMMDRWSEPRQSGEMLGHTVTHVALEAVAGMCQGQPPHQAITRHLGDDRRRRNGR